jgi:hypothetical protein
MRYLLSLFLSTLFISQTFAQTFPKERDKFVKEWQKLVLDEAAVPFLKEELPQKIKGSLLNETQFHRLVDNCNKYAQKAIPLYPEIYHYMMASIYQVENKFPGELVNPWFNYVNDYAKDPDENLTKFLKFSANFFRYQSFYREPTYRWTYTKGQVAWEEGKTLKLRATGIDLKCLKYDEDRKLEDSIVVYATSGYFDVIQNKWLGSKGVVTWEKVKFKKTETFANLRGYKCDFSTAKLKVDTVELTTPYFTTPILGKLQDLTTLDLGEGEKSPQFNSYEKRLKIPNLRDQMDYDGGFTMEGPDFIGRGTTDKPAKIIFTRKNVPLFEISSIYFEMNPQQVIARNAKAKMNYKSGDSLVIQSCFFTLNEQNKEISINSIKKGFEYLPFVDSYFQVYVYAPVLSWKFGTPDPYYTFEVGTAQEQKTASFQSMNYFDPSIFQKFQSIGSAHPFIQIAALVKKNNKMDLGEGEVASALKKTIDQAKPLLVDMASYGLLILDSDAKKVRVSPKLIAYAEASTGESDYDNLKILSDLRPQTMRESKEEIAADPNLKKMSVRMDQQNKSKRATIAYAVIQLDKNEMCLNQVNEVSLSQAQQTTIYPDSNYVTMYKNRDLSFRGWLVAGKMEFFTKFSKFDYEAFKINLLSTDEATLRVNPLRKEDGNERILMFSSFKNIKGELLIDDTESKSGRKGNNANYPILKSIGESKVYYSSKEILKGAYDSTRFYYAVNAFELDSLDDFSEASLRFEGSLNSAGIFPKIPEPLKIMNDYSLGFVAQAPEEGYPFYETDTKYQNKIVLSNNGLQGTGTINFLESISISKKLTFLPDSTIGLAIFDNKEVGMGVRYPVVHSEQALISYQPRKALMKVSSYGEKPLIMFKDNVVMSGTLLLDKKGMSGKGILEFKEASLNSKEYNFTNEDILSENSSFSLRNRFSKYGENPLAIQSDEMKTNISFKTRKGEFTQNGTKRIMFPANHYYCQMDKFTWFMDGESLDFQKNKGGETSFESGADLSRNNFFSTDEKQDTLQFKSLSAKYDLKTQLILCNAVDYIQVGDARIFPDSSRVRIRKEAAMDSLKNAVIVANYITKYHTFKEAQIKISSRKYYEGTAKYPYYDRDSNLTILPMSSIKFVNLTTTAQGEVKEKDRFKLSKEFDYYGSVIVRASNVGLFLNGSTRLNHTCQYDKSWMTFEDTVLATNIQIPINPTPKNAKGDRLAAGFLWRQTERMDSVRIYPSFLSKTEGAEDPSLFNSYGYLQYNQVLSEYQIASKNRLNKSDTLSNLLTLDVITCKVIGYGDIELGINTGDVKMDMYGKIEFDQEKNKTRIAANARLSMPIAANVMENIAAKMKLEVGAKEVDMKKATYGLKNTFVHWSNAKDAQEVFKDFDEDKLRKMPSSMEQTFILSDIVLESYGTLKASARKVDKGLISVNNQVGIVSINGIPILKQVEWHQFYVQSFSDELAPGFTWELSLLDDTKYFMNYTMSKRDGDLQIFTNDKTVNETILAIKPEKRKTKNFKFDLMDEVTAKNLLAKFRGYFLYK